MKPNFQKKLSAYSSLAGSLVLLSAAADAQIIYTNPPDITISGEDTFVLDLNNDGIAEALLIHESLMGSYMIIQKTYNDEQHEWLGYRFWQYNVPAVPLNAGKKIGANALPKMLWTEGEFGSHGVMCVSSETYFNIWAGKKNRYIGLRFVQPNAPGQWNYGWVRLSVPPGCTGAIIKDWAYNSVPDESILTGQTQRMADDGFFTEQKVDLENIIAYISNNQLHINNNAEGVEIEIRMIDMNGREIISEKSSFGETLIPLNSCPAGIYLVQLKNEQGNIVKKVFKD